MNTEHLFISDVHIGAFGSEKNQELESELLSLIQYSIQKRARIYILGDLFDYWMEFPGSNFIPKLGKEILDAFEEYNEQVEPALYVTGNHDNWTLSHFEERKFIVEHNHRIIDLGDGKVFVFHGDGTFKPNGDFSRPPLHRLLRSKKFLKIFQNLLPDKKGLAMMKRFSSFTRLRDVRNPIPLSKNAEWILENKDAQFVLCGHDHLPRVETYSTGTYINLGTFFKHRTLARYYDNEMKLVQWKSNSQEFVPFKNESD